MEYKLFVPSNMYPEEDVGALLKAALQVSGLSREQLLEEFGEFVIDPLMAMYPTLLPSDWGTVDLLLNVEEKIHSVVRMKIPNAKPAGIFVTQVEPNLLEVTYSSPRNLPEIAVGAIKGVAKHFGDRAEFLERKDMGIGRHQFLVRIHPGMRTQSRPRHGAN